LRRRREEKGFFEEERRLDKSRGVFWGIMGMVESEAALSDQLKGVEEIVAGRRGSKGGIEKGIDSETVQVGIVGSVCVDMVAELSFNGSVCVEIVTVEEEVGEMMTGLV
jgi:hypothetical protein